SYVRRRPDGSLEQGPTNMRLPWPRPTWPVDMNGDGLRDLVYVGGGPLQIMVQLNTGNGFLPPTSLLTLNDQTAGYFPSFSPMWNRDDDNVRIIDWDGDGNQDLLLVDVGAADGFQGPQRDTLRVL